jgi:hypothetical protein
MSGVKFSFGTNLETKSRKIYCAYVSLFLMLFFRARFPHNWVKGNDCIPACELKMR